jgi:hypothetical protein
VGLCNKKSVLTPIFRISEDSYCVAILDWANSTGAQRRAQLAANGSIRGVHG